MSFAMNSCNVEVIWKLKLLRHLSCGSRSSTVVGSRREQNRPHPTLFISAQQWSSIRVNNNDWSFRRERIKFMKEGLGEMMKHPEDIDPVMEWMMLVRDVEKQIPPQPHWAFCYTMLLRSTRNMGLSFLQLPVERRNPVMILFLAMRALDTIEDDMSLSAEVKIPMLEAFHEHISDDGWHFSCGTKYRVLMDHFYHVRTAFLELDPSYQEVIKEVIRTMGVGMAKFRCKEFETMDDFHEYVHNVTLPIFSGLSRIVCASKLEDSSQKLLSWTLLIQITDNIMDYTEDVFGGPEPHRFWPCSIWGKYANNLEDFKYKENSVKALQCLNEMVTIALTDAEDSLRNLSELKDPVLFRIFAIKYATAVGSLALCYNNIEVFRSGLNLKPRMGVAARNFDRIWKFSDLCSVVLEIFSMLKSKIEKHDPNALETLSRIEAVEKLCNSSCQEF